jgi:DNA polymerase III subunit chi
VAKVDFHSQVGDKLSYTYRLVRKIFSLATPESPLKKILVVGASDDLERFDQLLWSFNVEDFLPHVFIDDENAAFAPIILATEYDEQILNQLPHQDVFIHLGRDFLENIAQITTRFERVIEIVSMEPSDVSAGRERFKNYRSMGLELVNYDQKGMK